MAAQRQTGEIKDCSVCPGRCPELWTPNKEAWELWLAVDTQWRVAAFAVVGLDLPAVFMIADLFEIPVDKGLFQKLKLLERYELNRAKKEGDGRGE